MYSFGEQTFVCGNLSMNHKAQGLRNVHWFYKHYPFFPSLRNFVNCLAFGQFATDKKVRPIPSIGLVFRTRKGFVGEIGQNEALKQTNSFQIILKI